VEEEKEETRTKKTKHNRDDISPIEYNTYVLNTYVGNDKLRHYLEEGRNVTYALLPDLNFTYIVPICLIVN
jgi:hypothetical protein